MKPTTDTTAFRLDWRRIELWLGLLCLAAALCWHINEVTENWESAALPGNTFRQTQTGQTTRFIIADQNYSLAYPTPILGRPWAIPMEFPLYQWMVAALHQSTELSLVASARTISLLSLYCSFPAFWLLLAGSNIPRSRATWLMIPIVLSPVSTFYGRAFLIETTALSLAVWFVVSFCQLLRRPNLYWWLATSLLGALVGATKATTLIPAAIGCIFIAAYTLWRSRANKPEVRRLLQWGGTSALIPFGITWAWTHFADTVKAANPIGQFLQSDNLVSFNFGDSFLADRFTLSRWQELSDKWDHSLAPWWLIVAIPIVAVLVSKKNRGLSLLCCGVFFGTQLLLPNLYSIHDYYFVAITGVWGLSCAFLLADLMERTPAGAITAISVLIGISGLQIKTFDRSYAPAIQVGSPGDDLTNQLLRLTEEDEVIIVAGSEWNSFIPYFSERRALMLPFGIENDPDLRESAFSQLKRTEVAALVLTHKSRNNAGLIDAAVAHFGIVSDPLLKLDYADVFFTETVMAELLPTEGNHNASGDAPMQVFAETMTNRFVETVSLSRRQQRLFSNMSPIPTRFFFEFGPAVLNSPTGMLLNAHAKTELWFQLPSSPQDLLIEYGMFDPIWQEEHMVSDGVELQVDLLHSDGTETSLFRHYLNPRERENDRGPHTATIAVQSSSETEVRIRSHAGPNNQTAFDWFYIRRIQFKDSR